MEVHLTPELERKLHDVAAQSGVGAAELVQDVIAGYLEGVSGVREMLDGRYDDLKSGRVKLIDGEAFFEDLRQREDDLLNRPPK